MPCPRVWLQLAARLRRHRATCNMHHAPPPQFMCPIAFHLVPFPSAHRPPSSPLVPLVALRSFELRLGMQRSVLRRHVHTGHTGHTARRPAASGHTRHAVEECARTSILSLLAARVALLATTTDGCRGLEERCSGIYHPYRARVSISPSLISAHSLTHTLLAARRRSLRSLVVDGWTSYVAFLLSFVLTTTTG